jgi:Ca-activated chloride channel homolog
MVTLSGVLKAHRSAILANTPEQKLFISVRIRADGGATAIQPVGIAILVDTSGSMGPQSGVPLRIDQVCEALNAIIDRSHLAPTDQIAIVSFATEETLELSLQPIGDGVELRQAIATITKPQGITNLSGALRLARSMLSVHSGPRRVLLLTDGGVDDSDECRTQLAWFASEGIPISAVGIGNDWNESFVSEVTDTTHGTPYHAVSSGDPSPSSLSMTDLARAIADDWQRCRTQLVTDVRLTLAATPGLSLKAVDQVFPKVSPLSRSGESYLCGNLAANESFVLLLDLTCPPTQPNNSCFVEVTVATTGETPLVLQCQIPATEDPEGAFQIDPEVQNWLQQRNLGELLRRATTSSSPEEQRTALVSAQTLSAKLANRDLNKTIQLALIELDESKTVSKNLAKSLQVGGKTKTIDFGRLHGSSELDELILRTVGKPR